MVTYSQVPSRYCWAVQWFLSSGSSQNCRSWDAHIFFSWLSQKILNDSLYYQKVSCKNEKFWRAVSVNYFRGIQVWEEPVGSQPAQQEKDPNENALWAQNGKSLRNLLGLCTWWTIWGAIWSSGSFSPFHNICALCLQSCCVVKQSNSQGQIVTRMSLTRPRLQVNWSGHRWRLKPCTAPWQLGTSGGVVESRR